MATVDPGNPGGSAEFHSGDVKFNDPVVGPVSWDRTFIEMLAFELEKSREQLVQEYAQDFADKLAEWQRIQEQIQMQYTRIPARDLRPWMVICEPQGHGRRILKFPVKEIDPPRSRFDRKVVVVLQDRKRWVYDPADMVMVRSHA